MNTRFLLMYLFVVCMHLFLFFRFHLNNKSNNLDIPYQYAILLKRIFLIMLRGVMISAAVPNYDLLDPHTDDIHPNGMYLFYGSLLC